MQGIQIPIGLDMAQLNRNLAQVKGKIGDGLGRSLKNIGAMVGVAGGAGLAGFLAIAAKRSIELGAAQEQLAVAFETMLGSGEKAKKLLSEIEALGASTPFQYEELANAGKSLLAFGIESDKITGTLSRLGDVAAGLNIPLGDLAEIYGKARVQGRLFAEDINQLTGRGIPIIGQLAEQFGVTEGQVKKLVESGEVGFKNLETAIVAMTSKGGQFFGMMEKQSKTLNGLVSTLKDEFASLGREIGATVNPYLSETVKFLTAAVQEFKQFGLYGDAAGIGRRMAGQGSVVPMAANGPMEPAPIAESDVARRNRLFDENLKTLDAIVQKQISKDAAGAAPLGIPALRDLLRMAPAMQSELQGRAGQQLKEAVRLLFEGPDAKKSAATTSSAASLSDIRDIVNSDLVRIGGARGIGALGDQGLELQRSADRKLGELVNYAKTTAEKLSGFAYA